MKTIACILCLVSFLFLNGTNAQVNQEDKIDFAAYEDTLSYYADSLRYTLIPVDKALFNEKFSLMIKTILEAPGSFEHKFEKLKDHIHIIEPEDRSFKIFNWVIVLSEFQRKYYGILQTKDGKLFPLIDKSVQLEDDNRAFEVLSNREWYGCEIYNIHTVNLSNGTRAYALFGYNNNAYYSKKKLLDHLYFTEAGPVFGMPIISAPGGIQNRLIVEYKKEAFVSLNYNEEEKKIIFDRTTSEIGDPAKRYTYIPTGNLDGFVWRNDKWEFEMDVIPIMRLQDGQAPINGVFPGR